MPGELPTGPARLEFSREAHLVSRLRHPNIVPLYDFGEQGRLRYLVMRYMVGGTLADLVREKRLDRAVFARLVLRIAESLDYIHANAVVHRDLKPANVLLDGAGEPCLSDFGLAREVVLDSTLPIHTAIGTLPYMSPEQWRGERITPQSDCFSLGIVFFQLLTGQLPFEGRYALAIVQRETGQRLPDPATLAPDLPVGTHELLLNLTADLPADRPEWVIPVTQALVALLGVEAPVTVGPAAVPPPDNEPEATQEAYRADARHLIESALEKWQPGRNPYPLSLTTFLTAVTGDLPPHSLPAQATAMLVHGSLLYRRPVQAVAEIDLERWRSATPEADQREIGYVLLLDIPTTGGASDLLPDTLGLLRQLASSTPLPDAVQQHLIALAPTASEADGATILEVLASGLAPPPGGWRDAQTAVDGLLAELAVGESSLQKTATGLIIRTRSASALRQIMSMPDSRRRMAVLRETMAETRRLPPGTPPQLAARVLIETGLRQIADQPRLLLAVYLTIGLSCGLALGLLIYLTFRSPDFLSARRILNALAQGLLFGLQIGAGGFIAHVMASRLRILAFGVRLGLAVVVGGLITAWAFANWHVLHYDLPADSPLLLPGGLLFAAGFATGAATRRGGLRLILTGLGVLAALMVTWHIALETGDNPLIYFEYDAPAQTWALALLFAGIAGAGSLIASRWESGPSGRV
jgi:serine/threonine protein kinase